MTVEYLKNLYMEKYGDCIFTKRPVEVLVTLTLGDFEELNNDLLKSSSPLILLIEESDYMQPEPGSVFFTRINVPNMCEFIIEIGDEFEFGLLDKTQEHGEETL